MNTYPVLHDKSGQRTAAFEIENLGTYPGAIARMLSNIAGVSDVRKTTPFSSETEIKVEFRYLNQDFIVEEPWGDNSRYWIGPKNPEEGTPDISDLENAFRRAESPFIRVVIDVFTLRPIRRFFGSTRV